VRNNGTESHAKHGGGAARAEARPSRSPSPATSRTAVIVTKVRTRHSLQVRPGKGLVRPTCP